MSNGIGNSSHHIVRTEVFDARCALQKMLYTVVTELTSLRVKDLAKLVECSCWVQATPPRQIEPQWSQFSAATPSSIPCLTRISGDDPHYSGTFNKYTILPVRNVHLCQPFTSIGSKVRFNSSPEVEITKYQHNYSIFQNLLARFYCLGNSSRPKSRMEKWKPCLDEWPRVVRSMLNCQRLSHHHYTGKHQPTHGLHIAKYNTDPMTNQWT